MNRKDLYRSFHEVDDAILERSEGVQKAKKSSAWKWVATAACLCLCIMGVIKIWNPGMGCSQQVRDFVEENGTLYFSTWDDGVYGWNPDMKKPRKLSDTGRIADTNSGLVLYSMKQQRLWELSGFELREIGKFDTDDLLNGLIEAPSLIGIYDGYAYWCGRQEDPSADISGSIIVKTPLNGGKREDVLKRDDGSLENYCIREDRLYYYLNEFSSSEEKIYVRNLRTEEEILLTKLEGGNGGWPFSVYFMEKRILISDPEAGCLYQMDYTSGKPVFLTKAMPTTAGFSERDGKVYFQTSFGKNESGNPLAENLVSVDLETGELTRITDFVLDNGDGTIRYTLIKLAMTEGGFYFLDPHDGVRYHDDATNTETEIYRSK